VRWWCGASALNFEMGFARSVDAFVQNLGDLSQGGGELNAATLLFLACVLLLVALPCSIFVIVASRMGPSGNDAIPFTPSPDAPEAPKRPWKPNAKDKKLVDERLSQLKAKRPATKAQINAAYESAVYPHRSWSDSSYTGTLRPHNVSPRRTVKAGGKIQRPDYADSGSPHGEMMERMSFSRKIKKLSSADIGCMRTAGRLGREVLDIAALAVRPGVTCDEIDTLVHDACIKRNCYPSPLNYMRFPKSVCTSVNEVICHGVPDGYELQKGDIINLDVTVYYNGFHADLNETYFVGGK
jgi:Xaa-Pro aminopeptidase